MLRNLLLPAGVSLAVILPAAAHAQQPAPWSEQAIRAHVDAREFSGTLDRDALERLRDAGERLFEAKFTPADGLGRPMATQAITPVKRKRPARDGFSRTAGMDANACSSCHNEPVLGGSSNFSANAFVSEGFTNAEFDSLDPQFSNERNSNHLFGAGLVELLAREMSADLQRLRGDAVRRAREAGTSVEARLVTKGVDFGTLTVEPDGMVDLSGLDGVDTDLVIRPFSQKGVMTSLRQFAINAMNDHLGMQAVERYGARWTGENDFDEDGKPDELSPGDISALVAWQAGLRPPVTNVPDDPEWRSAARLGDRMFDDIGCASCHVRALPLDSLKFADPGLFDTAGTLRAGETGHGAVYDLALLDWASTLPRNPDGAVMVPLFGDLKRHRIADAKNTTLGNELLAQRFVDRDVFQTSELWGIGSTAPYGHRGDLTTLDEVIRAHGGEATPVTRRYEALAQDQRSALIAFLKTLVIEP
ncbi:MAG: di-heme oxidoredictase family protein [Pseudomonadota bacterium]|nr:di-heme oxidoredictase family protein [Pseudomonadota bacterium]